MNITMDISVDIGPMNARRLSVAYATFLDFERKRIARLLSPDEPDLVKYSLSISRTRDWDSAIMDFIDGLSGER